MLGDCGVCQFNIETSLTFKNIKCTYVKGFMRTEVALGEYHMKYMIILVQGSLCANETLCTNEVNLKFNISQINYYILRLKIKYLHINIL